MSRHGLRGLVARAHADVLDASKCGSDARVSGIYEPYYHLSEAIADANLSSHHLAAVMASRGTASKAKGRKAVQDVRGSGEPCVYRPRVGQEAGLGTPRSPIWR